MALKAARTLIAAETELFDHARSNQVASGQSKQPKKPA